MLLAYAVGAFLITITFAVIKYELKMEKKRKLILDIQNLNAEISHKSASLLEDYYILVNILQDNFSTEEINQMYIDKKKEGNDNG
jgi:dimeric dUTPase (all-alpha-NTP-PPase superfamily)